MTYKSQLGQLGEDMACEYLVKKGYKIIERNYRRKWGEIDIIAKSTDRTLVFVEVKTMHKYDNDDDHNSDGIQPEDQLTQTKLKKLKRTACLYAGHYPELVNGNRGWRIDLVAITIDDLTDTEKCCEIKHYENMS